MTTIAGDKLDITPLGAGNEVGRSCVCMTYKGKTVLVFLYLFYTEFGYLSISYCLYLLYVSVSGFGHDFLSCFVCLV